MNTNKKKILANASATSSSSGKIEKAKPPTMPDTSTLDVTDPARKLTRDEWKALSKEQKHARKAAVLAKRGPARNRVQKAIRAYANRVAKLAGLFNDPENAEALAINAAMLKAAEQIRLAVEDISDLPAGWNPIRKGLTTAKSFTVGTKVVLVDAKKDAYKEVVGTDPLTIKQIAGKRVVVESSSGVKLFLPIAHLKNVPTAKSE